MENNMTEMVTNEVANEVFEETVTKNHLLAKNVAKTGLIAVASVGVWEGSKFVVKKLKKWNANRKAKKAEAEEIDPREVTLDDIPDIDED